MHVLESKPARANCLAARPAVVFPFHRCYSLAFDFLTQVVDTRSIDENLPGAILAFFHIPGSDPQKARDTRARFIQAYRLELDVAPPVVKLDLSGEPLFTLLG